MTERERRDKELLLRLTFQRLHLTVVDEKNFLSIITISELYSLRDEILDKIIQIQRDLGIRK
jgi:hypothetical protein